MSGSVDDSQALLAALHPEGVTGHDHDIRYLGGNLREALAHYRILFPELVSYRGGLFIESAFDKHIVDEILDASMFDGGERGIAMAEQHVNGVSLAAEDDKQDFNVDIARANAAAIGWVWKTWIRETYGQDVRIETSISAVDDCLIWFETGSNGEDRLD